MIEVLPTEIEDGFAGYKIQGGRLLKEWYLEARLFWEMILKNGSHPPLKTELIDEAMGLAEEADISDLIKEKELWLYAWLCRDRPLFPDSLDVFSPNGLGGFERLAEISLITDNPEVREHLVRKYPRLFRDGR